MQKIMPNIFLIGPMGAGKTSVGKRLAKQLCRPFYDSDHEIMERTGVTIQWIFEVEKEQGFRKREANIIDTLSKMHHIVLSTGAGAITTPMNRENLPARGFVVYLTVDLETQFERATRRDITRPLLKVENPRERLIELNDQRAALYAEIAHLTIDTSTLNPDKIAEQIISQLK